MKDHTLMQTIARANRVTSWKINGVEKKNGEIIDYYNVFRNMRKALKDYAQGREGQEEPPVQEKKVLFTLLEDAIVQGKEFCREKDIDIDILLENTDIFKNVSQFNHYADTLLSRDEWRKGFAVYENTITSLYEACKPEILGRPVVRTVAVFQYLRGVVDTIVEQKDIDAVGMRISQLLDESVVVDGTGSAHESELEWRIVQSGRTWDLSKINFDKLKEDFQRASYKNIEISDLRAFIQRKLEQMLRQNAMRSDFAQRLQSIIDAYNAGSSSADNYFAELLRFTQDLQEESERHIRENLTEDELELFDLLKKDKMTNEETQKVRLAAKSLLYRLLEESPKVLVQDWFKDGQSKLRVRTAVETVLNIHLSESYDRVVFTEKCNKIFDLMLNQASQGLKWAA
jgi:type I restriction enzyme R subunit